MAKKKPKRGSQVDSPAPAEEAELYRLFIKEVQDYAIFAMDPDNRIVTWNSGVRRVLGYSRDEFIGRSGSMIFTPEDLRAGADAGEICIARRRGRAEDERWHVKKNGDRIWGMGMMIAIRDSRGKLRGFVKVMRDFTDRRNAEQQLRDLNETLEQRVRARTMDLLGYQQQLRALALELTRTEQVERQRITAELHDNIAQLMAVCAMRMGHIMEIQQDPKSKKMVQLASECLDHAIQSVRQLITGINPLILGENDLSAALEWAATPVRRSGLTVRINDDGRSKPLGTETLTLLAHIVRELLFNVLKHAGTKRASVRLRRRGSTVQITVRDPGRGFDVTNARLPSEAAGFGLFSIRERLAALGGELQIRSSPRGTAVTVIAPLKSAAGAQKHQL